jgi:hypothetical protein
MRHTLSFPDLLDESSRIPSIRGDGARIVDFLMMNPLTRVASIVELKTPGAKLLDKKYRGKGDAQVFPPHRDLTSAVAQLQAQIASAQSDFQEMLRRERTFERIETASLAGVVIVGSTNGLSSAQLESLHLYRSGLQSVEVVTFDEVLERLQSLRQIILSGAEDSVDVEE